MSRKVQLDSKRVILKSANTLGFATIKAKPGMWVTFNNNGEMCNVSSGRIIGRITSIEPDGLEDCRNWLCVMALSQDATFFMERWVNPDWVLICQPMPNHIKTPVKAKEPNKALAEFRGTL